MNEYLIEVINFVPSYYPFETKDRAIGLANFYAQKPTQNYRKLHDDIVYRRFIQTCDVVGVPIGPCNKLLKGNLIPCVRGGGGGGGPVPLPVCRGEALDLPCGCECPGSCLNDPGLSTITEYIENHNRDNLLQYIDGAANFPDSVPGGTTITNELAGNGYWIGLPPSCYGVWVALSDCETGSFSGFYHFDSPKIQNEIVFGVDNSVTLRGRGQRIKIAIDDPNSSEPRYERYQVYYAYEFAYQLGLQPPNDMTFKLAGDNLINLAENDFVVNTEPEGGIAEEGGGFEVSSDSYSRFCSSIFYPVQTRGCIRTTDANGGLGSKPCVCDEPYEQELPPIGEEIPLSERKYIRKPEVPDEYKTAGLFSYDDGSTTACENIVFERENADPDGGVAEIPISEEDLYYDAFSRSVITWNQNANWEDEQDGFNTWFSWTRTSNPVIVWNNSYVHDNCHDCITKKKKNGINDPGVPPCENIPCERIQINAEPDANVFDAWAALDSSSGYSFEGGVAGDGFAGITRSQAAEWDFFAKFGFPTLETYKTYDETDISTDGLNKKWYDEIKSRFTEPIDDGGVAGEILDLRFVREFNQHSIPCFPRNPCINETRITQIYEIYSSCDGENESGTKIDIVMGADISAKGCLGCPSCYPPDCCISTQNRYEISSSPIALAHIYPVDTINNQEYSSENNERYKNFAKNFNKNTTDSLECYIPKCSAQELQDAYDTCVGDSEDPQVIQDCIDQVIEQCEAEIYQYYVPTSPFKCNNVFEGIVITKGSENWLAGGVPLSNCGEVGISAISKCVYEITPTRPSSDYWVAMNIGQCVQTTCKEIDLETGCKECEYKWSSPRTAPIYRGVAGVGCPNAFCNTCKIDSFSECSCCSVNFLESENSKRESRSVSSNCLVESCPACCSMCLENEEGIHLCNDVNLLPDDESVCFYDECDDKALAKEDCIIIHQNPQGKVNICPCDPTIDPGCDPCYDLPGC